MTSASGAGCSKRATKCTRAATVNHGRGFRPRPRDSTRCRPGRDSPWPPPGRRGGGPGLAGFLINGRDASQTTIERAVWVLSENSARWPRRGCLIRLPREPRARAIAEQRGPGRGCPCPVSRATGASAARMAKRSGRAESGGRAPIRQRRIGRATANVRRRGMGSPDQRHARGSSGMRIRPAAGCWRGRCDPPRRRSDAAARARSARRCRSCCRCRSGSPPAS